AVLRVLDVILQGLVRIPPDVGGSGPVAAALELLNPQPPGTVEELAVKIGRVYPQHERFMKLRRERWLALLDGLARTELPDPPDSLESKLRAHLDAHWIVIDCLGLPLANTLQKV